MRRIAVPFAAITLLQVVGRAADGSARSTDTSPISCPRGMPHTTVVGRLACLAEGTRCRTSRNPTFHLHGFHCRALVPRRGALVLYWRGLRERPLHVPAIESGTSCPTSSRSAPERWGPGPAYPALGADGNTAVLYFQDPPADETWRASGWGGNKVIWIVTEAYRGPVLVRGRQLDGPNAVRFQNGSPAFTTETSLRPPAELQLVGPNTHGNPATTRVRAPGCYAYQVDGANFSYLIVFEARVVPPG